MAGYSGKPLAKKLGIKPGHRVSLMNAPERFEPLLGEIPPDVTLSRRLGKGVNVVLLFVTTDAGMKRSFAKAQAALAQDGGLWVCWPKRASGVETDLTENTIRDYGLACGLVDNKVCAVDETWSGLRFVIRLKDRKA